MKRLIEKILANGMVIFFMSLNVAHAQEKIKKERKKEFYFPGVIIKNGTLTVH